MNRLIEHQRADGSSLRYAWDSYGRLAARVDPVLSTDHLPDPQA